jgi:hypothetical protein
MKGHISADAVAGNYLDGRGYPGSWGCESGGADNAGHGPLGSPCLLHYTGATEVKLPLCPSGSPRHIMPYGLYYSVLTRQYPRRIVMLLGWNSTFYQADTAVP